MAVIRVLPDVLASQVAAGEVIERPASVIRELVENSLDAGAREIAVEIRRGGVSRMKVTDDGCGMNREDALLCFERHATSKLGSTEDLAAIRTLGFRGEAMPSIASVAKMRLITRLHDAVAGTEVEVAGGVFGPVRDAGCAPGTSIEVSQLFFNVPARRKFLRAESTEAAHIEQTVRMHALAAPHVRFSFQKDEHGGFELPAVESPSARILHLHGAELARELIEVPAWQGNGFSIHGYLLPASHARKGKRHQCLFLNGRPVEDGAISRGLRDGFRGLPDGTHPAAWLWIEMEPQLVDVNVHPAKREVRFRRPSDLQETIRQAVDETTRPKPVVVPKVVVPAATTTTAVVVPVSAKSEKASAAVLLEKMRSASPQVAEPAAMVLPHRPAVEVELPIEPERATEPSSAVDAGQFTYLGALHRRFLLWESAGGLVVMDPAAARERIAYEQLRPGMAVASVERQALLIPSLVELTPAEADVLLRGIASFEEAGFEIQSFGGNTFQVGAVPAVLGEGDPGRAIRAVIDEWLDGGKAGARQMGEDQVARGFAKQIARMQDFPRDPQQLLENLLLCELPFCAPDGRPTLSELSLMELERRFRG